MSRFVVSSVEPDSSSGPAYGNGNQQSTGLDGELKRQTSGQLFVTL